MRSVLHWFSPRRRLMAIAFIGLVAMGVLSAGDTPLPDEWVRIPDLGVLLIIVIVGLAVFGLVLITLSPAKVERRSRGEVRTIKALLILVAVVAAIALWVNGRELATEPFAEGQEQTIVQGEDLGAAGTGPASLGASGTDLWGLALILLVVMGVVIRGSRRSRNAATSLAPSISVETELTAAVERAHRHLNEVSDPRTAVMVAYSELEDEMARIGLERAPSETAVEHMGRALADLPHLAAPAVRLGGLYEIARFSDETITEADRRQAIEALSGARALVGGKDQR